MNIGFQNRKNMPVYLYHAFLLKVSPGGPNSKESAYNVGDLCSILGFLERFPGGRHGNPLQYSCLENPHGQRILVGYSALGSQRIRHDWSNLALIIQVTLRDYHNLPSLLKSNFLDCSSNGLISLSSTLPFFPFTKKKPLFKSILLKWTEYEGFKWNQSLPLCIISQTTDPSNSLAPQLLPS